MLPFGKRFRAKKPSSGSRGGGKLDADDAKLLQRLEAEFDADPDAFIEASQRPNSADFQLIGTMIQVYCFAEHSARQIIDEIRIAAPEHNVPDGSRLAGHVVFPKLGEVAKLIKDCSMKEALVRASVTVEMHRKHRHTFAHWVVRRVDKGRAFLVLSKNAQEGAKRHGKLIEDRQTSYGIFPVATLRRELQKLEEHTQNLSVAAAAIGSRPDELRRMIVRPDAALPG